MPFTYHLKFGTFDLWPGHDTHSAFVSWDVRPAKGVSTCHARAIYIAHCKRHRSPSDKQLAFLCFTIGDYRLYKKTKVPAKDARLTRQRGEINEQLFHEIRKINYISYRKDSCCVALRTVTCLGRAFRGRHGDCQSTPPSLEAPGVSHANRACKPAP